MSKDIIYYTDNRLEDPIYSAVQKTLLDVELPIISSSLKPINFGDNAIVTGKRGYPTMVRQIISCLERSTAQYVFFCEHDVLYPKSHFDFTPPKDNIFYYNANVWRWKYPEDMAITYDRLISLSGLCANRYYTLAHYNKRLEYIESNKWEDDAKHEPDWARKMGYEPGTKKKKRGGYTDDNFETWKSDYPMVDIRHSGTFSQPKVTLSSFKHQPTNWTEIKASQIPGWNLKEMFGLWHS